MANNFVNSFASIVTAGEYYQSDATDASTGLKQFILRMIVLQELIQFSLN